MKLRVTRREALQRLGAAALAAGVPVLSACAPSNAELDARLAEGVARLAGDGVAPSAIASAAPLPRAQALARLRGDASPRLLWAATASGFALRTFLARRREGDLREGRLRWVNGWLLTEVEIAAANLAAG